VATLFDYLVISTDLEIYYNLFLTAYLHYLSTKIEAYKNNINFYIKPSKF